MRPEHQEISREIQEALESSDSTRMQELLSDLHPSEIGQLLRDLPDQRKIEVVLSLDWETAARTLVESDESSKHFLLERLDAPAISRMVQELPSDDAADLLGILSGEKKAEVLKTMVLPEAREIEDLLKYDEESAGGIMATELVFVREDARAQDAIEIIRGASRELKNLHYVYVTDSHALLKGVFSLRQLLLAKPDAPVSDFMDSDVIVVTPDMDQEEVADLFRRYNLLAVPVVDDFGKLIGRITVDDIIDVIDDEASEDISLMAGTDEEEISEMSALRVSGIRLPWLMVAMGGQLVAATLIRAFEGTLSKVIALAFFIPAIMATGGNTGIQSSTIVIRALATGEMGLPNAWRQLFKELRVALINGLILGVFILVVTDLWLDLPKLGIVLGVSMLAIVITAGVLGATMPLVLKRFGVDPAVATGPFVTTTNDVIGILIYLGLATALMKFMDIA
jgi:magnesium transporter